MTDVRDLTGVLNSGKDNINNLSINKRTKLSRSTIATILLVSAFIGIVVGVNSRSFSSITSHLEANTKVKTHKDTIELAVNMTRKAIQQIKATPIYIEKLITKRKGLTLRETGALKDCLQMVSKTLDELTEVTKGLEEYHSKKSLKQHAEVLKTLISSAITVQNTCLDGFSHDDADKKVRNELEKREEIVEKMCSEALAMIFNIASTDIADESKLLESNFSEWAKWLSAGDRKLLQSGTVVTGSRSVKSGGTTFESSAVGLHPKSSPRGSKYSRRTMPLDKIKG